MTSSRLILIFLAFIFLIIVILSSNRISSALRASFGKMIPSLKTSTTVEDASLTPTPTMETETPTPSPSIIYGGRGVRNSTNYTKSMPAAGPEDLVWLILGGSFFAGVTLKKISGGRV
ncbi:hypothetical protein HY029_05820 [Candidatus Gottesmanbacteria bacterium]|nr:hypothetical protein [Candidatus Gottesmanbacteria bacterium]